MPNSPPPEAPEASGEVTPEHQVSAFADPTVSIGQKLRWLLGSASEYENENEDAGREEYYRTQTDARLAAIVAYVEALEKVSRLSTPQSVEGSGNSALREAVRFEWGRRESDSWAWCEIEKAFGLAPTPNGEAERRR